MFKNESHFYKSVLSDRTGVLRMVLGAIIVFFSDGNQALRWPSGWLLCATH